MEDETPEAAVSSGDLIMIAMVLATSFAALGIGIAIFWS
jgi:hypothetical protein